MTICENDPGEDATLTSSDTVEAIEVELPLERGELGLAEPAVERKRQCLRRFSSQKINDVVSFAPDFYLLRQNDLS